MKPYTVKPPNTVLLGGKQNGGFIVHKKGKEWCSDVVFGGTRYSGGHGIRGGGGGGGGGDSIRVFTAH